MYKIPEHTKAVDVADDMRFPKELFSMSAEDREHVDYVLLPEGLIRSRVECLSQEIIASLQGQNCKEVHLMCIMNGAFQFFAHLLEYLNQHVATLSERIYVVPHFVQASSYLNTETTGKVEISKMPNIKDKHVIVVEDMVDTGTTMVALLEKLKEHGAKKVESVVAFYKKKP
jgi:hypoxanthine phosphoribosyltransferase